LFDFYVPIGFVGDCFDRYKIRMEEMRQSSLIISDVINMLGENKYKQQNYVNDNKIVPPTRP
jgi:NADH-quinone oxidoreductase subunit D